MKSFLLKEPQGKVIFGQIPIFKKLTPAPVVTLLKKTLNAEPENRIFCNFNG